MLGIFVTYFPTLRNAPAMKFIPELQMFKTLPRELRSEFMVQIDVKGIDRQIILAWACFIFNLMFLLLDYKRKVDGTFYEYPIYPLYEAVHYVGLLFIIPAVTVTIWKKRILPSRLYRGIVIYGILGLLVATFFSMSILQYYEKGSLVLYMCYLFAANWAFSMNHAQRLTFNIASCALIIAVILLPFPDWARFDQFKLPAQRLVGIYEALGFTTIAFFFNAFDYNLRRDRFLDEKQLEKEKQRSEELEKFKSHMYTNLTHEFRTPLTIISGMADKIEDDAGEWAEKGSNMIKRNSGTLLNLVNQILDLSKLETGGITVKLVHGDVLPYLGYVVDSFNSYAEAKGVTLDYFSLEENIYMDYDPDKALKIVSNLLSNAIKHTPNGGNIHVEVARIIEEGAEDKIRLTVKDTGPGIPEDKLPHIFDRFFRVDDNGLTGPRGTGIGLSVVKELTVLMAGTIEVRSQVGRGTEFALEFPIREDASTEDAEFSASSVQEIASSFFHPEIPQEDLTLVQPRGLEEVPRLLIIDDNADVRDYLKTCLERDYQITTANNGAKGIKKALQNVPDLVLSDVMMPEKDGFEVCQTLKQDVATSHIPIVLLTAKADVSSRLEGLEHGADGYLSKPFNEDELKYLLRNLIRLRKMVQQRYESSDQTETLIESGNKEDVFVGKVRAAIIENLDDADFGSVQLCRAIGLSRSQLHNKLKALTGKSASLFIRFVRLQKGYDLLREGDLNVSEVAYDVGFRDPNYFTRTFTEQYGVPPSRVRGNG